MNTKPTDKRSLCQLVSRCMLRKVRNSTRKVISTIRLLITVMIVNAINISPEKLIMNEFKREAVSMTVRQL
ncbi:hypothetical protein [Bacillus dakarensis]|uniref:hypothetical protein n=1 Tax=Robertmurraya dakarensis TaxID=1926278 RepID=UPI00111555A3|nr:hypothetical protein [Bacillus dakarensis]